MGEESKSSYFDLKVSVIAITIIYIVTTIAITFVWGIDSTLFLGLANLALIAILVIVTANYAKAARDSAESARDMVRATVRPYITVYVAKGAYQFAGTILFTIHNIGIATAVDPSVTIWIKGKTEDGSYEKKQDWSDVSLLKDGKAEVQFNDIPTIPQEGVAQIICKDLFDQFAMKGKQKLDFSKLVKWEGNVPPPDK